ncbi:MAG TPA: hypothetical protein VK028_13730 [Micromonosporaceae bacterium]|nr:hypothetical protein [Micromonosporaceae bacterium]
MPTVDQAAYERAIPDEVWESIPPWMLRRRSVGAVICLAVALVLAGTGMETLNRSGAFEPRVVQPNHGWDAVFIDVDGRATVAIGMPVPSDVAIAYFHLRNTGWSDERILSIDVRGPGFDFLRAHVGHLHRSGPNRWSPGGRTISPDEPYVLAAGAEERFGVDLRITDCRVVDDPQIELTLDSWRGTRTLTLPMPRVHHNDGGGWRLADPDDPLSTNGIRYLADRVCAAHAS